MKSDQDSSGVRTCGEVQMTFGNKALFYYCCESWECLWKFIVKCMGLQSPEHILFLALGFLCTEIPSHTPLIILGLVGTFEDMLKSFNHISHPFSFHLGSCRLDINLWAVLRKTQVSGCLMVDHFNSIQLISVCLDYVKENMEACDSIMQIFKLLPL